MLEQSLNVEGRHSEQAQQPERQTLSKFKENGSVYQVEANVIARSVGQGAARACYIPGCTEYHVKPLA